MAARAGRKAIRLCNGIINLAVLVAILLLLAFGCYAIWDSGQVYQAADAAQYEIYKPGVTGASFEDLQAINPEVISWLTVYGTHIDYPVAQGPDNMKYIDTDAKGSYSLSGALFLDYRSKPDFSDFSSIIYGHHMDKNTMFGEIGDFSDKNYFDSHEYGTLYYGGQKHGLEFFAVVEADAYDESVFRTGITDPDEAQIYLNKLMGMALYTRPDVPVTAGDHIVLLSTCSSDSTNGRDILIGKITDRVFDDPFQTQTTDTSNKLPMIDAVPSLWAQFPLWGKLGVITLPSLLILLAIVLTYKKRRKK